MRKVYDISASSGVMPYYKSVIYEWKLDGTVRNFGDALYELILEEDLKNEWSSDLVNLYFPIGSVICNQVIEDSLAQGFTPIFHDCGWRGEEIDPELAAQCRFYGARGPHTQAALQRAGVSVDVTEDPAYLLPNYVEPGEPNGMAIAVRHIMDETEHNPNSIFDYKVDAFFNPKVQDKDDLIQFTQIISGARFVLTGSLHAAIVAHAYGVPFALLGGEYIDCPAKWADWLAAIDFGEPVWVENLTEGREWYNSVVRN